MPPRARAASQIGYSFFTVASVTAPRATAVLIDELNAGRFEGTADYIKDRATLHLPISPLLSGLDERPVRRRSRRAILHQLSPEHGERQRHLRRSLRFFR
jgi:hypothetical protein